MSDKRVQVCLTEEEYERYKKAAKEAGVSFSQYFKNAADNQKKVEIKTNDITAVADALGKLNKYFQGISITVLKTKSIYQQDIDLLSKKLDEVNDIVVKNLDRIYEGRKKEK